MRSVSSDRVAGIVLLALSCLYLFEARGFEVGFIADPIGPKAFPYVLGALLAILSLWLIFAPGSEAEWPPRRFWLKWTGVFAGLLVYAGVLEKLGFIASTFLLALLVSVVFGASVRRATVLALALSVSTYFLFSRALALPLPPGSIFMHFLSGGS